MNRSGGHCDTSAYANLIELAIVAKKVLSRSEFEDLLVKRENEAANTGVMKVILPLRSLNLCKFKTLYEEATFMVSIAFIIAFHLLYPDDNAADIGDLSAQSG